RLVHVSSPSVAHTGRPLVGARAGRADPRNARGHYSRSKAVAERVALREIIVDAFKPLTGAQVIERLELAQIANAQVNSMADVWAHPQLRARHRWVDVQTPTGPVPALLPPGAKDAQDARMDAVPALGADSGAILAELGYTREQIEQLENEGAL
ncbi:MAG: CoA transferase, partial [Gammaproteobacteria bacterium]